MSDYTSLREVRSTRVRITRVYGATVGRTEFPQAESRIGIVGAKQV